MLLQHHENNYMDTPCTYSLASLWWVQVHAGGKYFGKVHYKVLLLLQPVQALRGCVGVGIW